MIIHTTGDLLLSDAQALVNTVNCEGYMGKGIAYQFKQRYPKNHEIYRSSCKAGLLRPGKLLCFEENCKLIINFPTKDKWRNDSKLSYIDDGLTELVSLIKERKIESIAIPPLGAGNGGLMWGEVRPLIERKLRPVENATRILIYEPSSVSASRPVKEPRLSASAIVLMEIKKHLVPYGRISKLRFQKAGYFVNIFLSKPYFKFTKYKFGPYCHAIDVISNNIKDFQNYHGVESTEEAEKILYQKIHSRAVEQKMSQLLPAIDKACRYVGSIQSDKELEGISTACYIVETNQGITLDRIFEEFQKWSPEKAKKFSRDEVSEYVEKLYASQVIEAGMMGYVIRKI